MKSTLILLFLFTSLSFNLQAQSKYSFESARTISANRWEVIDIVFHTKEDVENPFNVRFGAEFTGPISGVLHLPGFYDGNNNFIIRFSGSAVGTWNFVTSSSVPALAGKSGKITVSACRDSLQHGPLIVSRPNHFSYADGTPCFLLSYETDWLFALDYHNPDLPKTRKLLSTIRSYGFNQVIMNVYAYNTTWKRDPSLKKKYDYSDPDCYPFGGTNGNPDFNTLNTGFFDHLDKVIHLLDSYHIEAHLMIYVWNKGVNWPPMNSYGDNLYFDYVIKRYQAYPNIVWDVAKEALSYGRCDMAYVTERISRIRRLDAYRRLITVHDYKYCSRNPGQVDFISVQDWQSDLHSGMMKIAERDYGKPIFNIENGGYERGPYTVFKGDYTDPVACLWRNYQTAFAGIYSNYYWEDTAWNVIIPDPMDLPDSTRPKLTYYKYFSDLFSRFNFASLAPVQDVSSSGFALTDGKGTYLFLVPSQNSGISLTLKQLAGIDARISWFDPLTGKYFDSHTQTIEAWQHLDIPAGHNFLVLVISGDKNQSR